MYVPPAVCAVAIDCRAHFQLISFSLATRNYGRRCHSLFFRRRQSHATALPILEISNSETSIAQNTCPVYATDVRILWNGRSHLFRPQSEDAISFDSSIYDRCL